MQGSQRRRYLARQYGSLKKKRKKKKEERSKHCNASFIPFIPQPKKCCCSSPHPPFPPNSPITNPNLSLTLTYAPSDVLATSTASPSAPGTSSSSALRRPILWPTTAFQRSPRSIRGNRWSYFAAFFRLGPLLGNGSASATSTGFWTGPTRCSRWRLISFEFTQFNCFFFCGFYFYLLIIPWIRKDQI